LTKVFSYAGVNPETGLYQFRNSKGELTSDPSDPADKIAWVSTDPTWYGGFSNTFSYKNISLSAFFSFVSQMGPNQKFNTVPGINFNYNSMVNVLDHWRKPGDNAPLQMVSMDFGKIGTPWRRATNSDGAYSRIRYARLQNLTLAYTLSPEVAQRLKLSNLRLFLQGQNLFTISNFENGDPEIQDTRWIGLIRRYTIGAQFTF